MLHISSCVSGVEDALTTAAVAAVLETPYKAYASIKIK